MVLKAILFFSNTHTHKHTINFTRYVQGNNSLVVWMAVQIVDPANGLIQLKIVKLRSGPPG